MATELEGTYLQKQIPLEKEDNINLHLAIENFGLSQSDLKLFFMLVKF